MFTCRKAHGHGRGKRGGGRSGHNLGLTEYHQYHSGRGRSGQAGCKPQECRVSEMNRAAAGATCPLCKKHCPLSDPGCPKGEAVARSITPQG